MKPTIILQFEAENQTYKLIAAQRVIVQHPKMYRGKIVLRSRCPKKEKEEKRRSKRSEEEQKEAKKNNYSGHSHLNIKIFKELPF